MQRHYPLDPATGVENQTLVWTDGVPSTGTEGSYPPHLLCTNPQDELINFITASGITPADGDLTQVLQAASIGIDIGTFGGTADALTATLPGNIIIPQLVRGMTIRGIIAAANATTSPTLAIAGFTIGSAPEPIKRSAAAAPAVGDLRAGAQMAFRFDGTNWRIVGLAVSDVAPAPPGAIEGVKYASNKYSLDVPDLSEQDAVAAADPFVYFDVSAGVHVKIPFSVLAAAVLAGFAAQPHSALTLNPKVMQFQQQRSGSSSAVRFSTGGTGVFITRALNTEVANQVNPGVALNTSTNYVTLPANAAYRISAQGMHHGAGQSAIRIYDRTNNVELIRSPSSDSHVDYPDHQSSYDTNVTLGAQILNFRLVVGSTPIQISLDHASFAAAALGSMGDDATGYTTIDADLYILQEAGSQ